MRTPLVIAAVAALSFSRPAALVAQGTPATDSVAPLPSITLPAPLDRVLRDYERAWQAGDAAALARLFAEDGFVLQGGRPPVRGRSAIQAAYAGQGGGPLRLRALAYATQEPVGYIIGAYGYADSTNAVVRDMGKFTLTLRLGADGRWLIFSDMDNSSQRPRRPGS